MRREETEEKKIKGKKKRIIEMKKQRNRKFGMKRRKQKNLKKRLRNWFFKGSTNKFISSEKK